MNSTKQTYSLLGCCGWRSSPRRDLIPSLLTIPGPHGVDQYSLRFDRKDIERNVLRGERMLIPKTVPPAIAALITKCWADSPQARPTFQEVVRVLMEILETLPKGPLGSGGRWSWRLKTERITSLTDQCIKALCIHLDCYKYDFPGIVEIYDTCKEMNFQVDFLLQ